MNFDEFDEVLLDFGGKLCEFDNFLSYIVIKSQVLYF